MTGNQKHASKAAVKKAENGEIKAGNIIANNKYQYLEQQEGFPQFSEFFEQQKTGKPTYGLTIEERAEQLKVNARSDMDELSLETPMYIENSSGERFGKMDEI